MKKILLVGAMLGMLACTTPRMSVDSQLINSGIVMPVQGRQGWLMNQKISFGKFYSSKVSRGWLKSYKYDFFLVGLEGANEKYSFTMYDEKNSFTALCANKVKGLEIPLDRFVNNNSPDNLFSFGIQTKDVFTSNILDENQNKCWNLLILNPDDFRKDGKYVGVLSNNEYEEIVILPVRTLQEGKTIGKEILGFEFKEGEKVIGAVEIINKGTVWLDPSLDENKKLLLATACSAILLQSDLHAQVDSI